ncbi:MAG: hypothetical protein FWD57_11495 [Polyangiaceae bacterium]|nr:hypothetical protein [Polyangiaceae bacterium]
MRNRWVSRISAWLSPLLVAGLVGAVAGSAGGSFVGCKADDPKALVVAELPEVQAPANHLADIFVAKPEETFLTLRANMGGPAALVPATFPAMVVTSFGLTTQLLDQIDGRSPIVGVITDDGSRVVVVLGIHVRDGGRVVRLLTEGVDAKYAASAPKQGIVVLEERRTPNARFGAYGVAGNYLLVAPKDTDLLECGPYVVGTLSKRTGLEGSAMLVAKNPALKGQIAKRIRGYWAAFKSEREKEDEMLREQRAREPDFGDPAAVLADVEGKVEAIAEILADLDQATLRIDVDSLGINTTLTMDPNAGGRASKEFGSMATGGVKPALALPQGTIVGLLTWDNDVGPKATGDKQGDLIAALLGNRAKDKDKQLIRDSMSAWARGRGRWLALSLQTTPREMEIMARGSVSDPALFEQGVRGVLGLLDVPAIRGPMEHNLGKLTIGKVKKTGAGALVRVDRKKAGKGSQPAHTSTSEVAWKVEGSEFELRLLRDGGEWLGSKDAPGGSTLADTELTAKVLGSLGDDTSMLLVFDPQVFVLNMVPASALKERSAPLVVAYGGESKQGWVKVVLSHATAREIIKILGRRD